jgi:ATP-dependent DNA helicase RecG
MEVRMAEKQNIEWKQSWHDEYLKWICGFANAQGGKLYIGKDDKGNVVGLPNSKKLMEDIPNKVRDVLGIIVDVNLYSELDKDYIEIVVNQNPYPVSYYGEFHYRTGSTKQLLKDQVLTHFLLQKTGISWSFTQCNAAFENII